MKMLRFVLMAIVVTALAAGLTGCKKEGCTDPMADNYNEDAKKDDGNCTYPTIAFSSDSSSASGTATGGGGTASETFSWTNPKAYADYNIDISGATEGSMQMIVKDGLGAEVLNQTLTKGSGDDTATGVTAVGDTTASWSVIINVNGFNGNGSYSLTSADSLYISQVD